MKPFRHLRHPAQHLRCVQSAAAACAFVLALGWPCSQAAATVVTTSAPENNVEGMLAANAGALNVTPPGALEAAGTAPADEGAAAPKPAAAPRAVSSFENVLREQDPAEVPLSLALMGGVLGLLYVRRRKR